MINKATTHNQKQHQSNTSIFRDDFFHGKSEFINKRKSKNQFNPKLDISKLDVKKISEASRIQRRGRVGRVSAGIVYYMYGKGKREDDHFGKFLNKPYFGK